MPPKKKAQSTNKNPTRSPTHPAASKKAPNTNFPPRANKPAFDQKNTNAPKVPSTPSINYQQIQQDEVEVLKSIWMDDYEHVEKLGAWNTSNFSFKLHLKTQEDEEIGCALSVTMTATYPKTTPELKLGGFKGVRAHEQEKLAKILEDLPQQLVGQEMIHELATAIKDCLDGIVQMRRIATTMPTFHDQRLKKEELKKELARKEEEEKRLEKERADMEAERVMGAMIEQAKKKRKEKMKELQEKKKQVALDITEDEKRNDQIVFDREIAVQNGEGGAPFVFHRVCGMVKIAQGPVTSVYTVKATLPKNREGCPPLILKSVELGDGDSQHNFTEGKRQIQNLESELDIIRTLHHPNVSQLHEFKVCQISSLPPSWRIFILMEYAEKGSLRDLLETVETLDVEIARSWIIQLLEGLEYIHKQSIYHGAVHVANVLLYRPSSADSTSVKLGDVCYPKLIAEFLNKEVIAADSSSAFWSPPESLQKGLRSNRKTDIWNLGVVFLQMTFGLKVMQVYDSPETLIKSIEISSSLFVFLGSIFKADPKKRPTAFDLLPSEFLRNNDPVLPECSQSPASRKISPTITGGKNPGKSSNVGLQTVSRYSNDFTETGRLGKGGFGEVVKAKNRLDGRLYAVKKITQSYGSSLTEILHEVRLLSQLNHRYVVRYFTAWLEEDISSIRINEGDEEVISAAESMSRSGSTAGSDNEAGFDYGESRGLDFISSSGYPPIQFGYDSNDEPEGSDEGTGEEGEENEENESADENYQGSRDDISEAEAASEPERDSCREIGKSKKNATRKDRREERKRKVTLYIQMELCERKTLRDLLRGDLHLRLEEGWRLLRQILEGLAHIHSLGIIHRDLKPDNIFIDFAGNPRIGDFGLATSNDWANVHHSDSMDSDMTTDVGTALYVAPELRSHGQGKYNDKVDMYSLGIIFFEMCYPLKTAMERDQLIRQLRMKDFVLPPEFHTEKKSVQGVLITLLINHRPSERPSSRELLENGKLPVDVEDEKMRQALQSLADPNNPNHQKAMRILFSQSTKDYQDYMYESRDNLWEVSDLLLQEQVKERLRQIFRRHGAVETSRNMLVPKSRFYSSEKVVRLLDSSGVLVQLPWDLTLLNARALARDESTSPPKTFTFGQVFRENLAGGQPTQHGQVDFDIVSFNSLDLVLKEAEVIKVIDEILDAFPSTSTIPICYHLNHSALLDLILEFCRINNAQKPIVKEILSKLNTGSYNFASARGELRKVPDLGVSATSLDDLARFDWRTDLDKAIQRIQSLFEGTSCLDRSASIFNHITSVVAYLKRFGIRRRAYICPLGTWMEKFYRGGLMFQVVYDTKKRDTFAAGGRYDSLIQAHRPIGRNRGQETHAVGFTMAWEKLIISMARYLRQQAKNAAKRGSEFDVNTGEWGVGRCDVLVASFDKTLLRTECITILQELWANDIKAELAVDAPNPERLLQMYKNDGFCWIVICKATPGNSGERHIKIKNLFRKEEVEVNPGELVTYLKVDISERDRYNLQGGQAQTFHHHDRTKPLRQAPDMVAGEEHFSDVRILTVYDSSSREKKVGKQSAGPSKKTNRRNIIEQARSRVADTAISYRDGPIIVLESKDEVLEAIKFVPLKDHEGWKKITQMAAATERKYINHIQGVLLDLANEGSIFCYLYNVKTQGVVLYHFS